MKTMLVFILVIMYTFSSCTSLKKGLVAYYPFNGNANDYSGYGNNGVVSGASLTLDKKGRENSAYYFNGNNAYIDLGNSFLIKRYQKDFSASFWVKLNSYSKSYCSIIFSNRNKPTFSGSMVEIAGQLSNQHKQVIFYKNILAAKDSTNADFVNSSNYINLNKWYHVCVTYKYNGGFNNLVRVYMNGKLDASRTISATIDPGNGHTFVGIEPELYTDYSLDGSVDEIRFYNRVLEDSEVKRLYRNIL